MDVLLAYTIWPPPPVAITPAYILSGRRTARRAALAALGTNVLRIDDGTGSGGRCVRRYKTICGLRFITCWRAVPNRSKQAALPLHAERALVLNMYIQTLFSMDCLSWGLCGCITMNTMARTDGRGGRAEGRHSARALLWNIPPATREKRVPPPCSCCFCHLLPYRGRLAR